MAKWCIFGFFCACIVLAMHTGELWTVMILIPTFALLYTWAEAIYE